MKIDNITNGIKRVAYKTIDVANEMGKGGREFITHIASKTGEKKDSFVKNEKLKEKLNKDTVIGFGIIAEALVLAKDCIKGITGKVKEIKDNKD